MHKLYNQATWQVGQNRRQRSETERRSRGREGGGRLSQVLNVAMANDALKPKTKQLPKSFCREDGGKEVWQPGCLACLAGLADLPGWLAGWLAKSVRP